MIDRCANPENSSFQNYGARGISVCDRWRLGDGKLTGFECFTRDMGDRPRADLTIEREDSNGPYSPENCRWADRTVQSRNRRGLRMVTIGEETKPASVWAEGAGVPYFTFIQRLNRGISPERALTSTDLRSSRLR